MDSRDKSEAVLCACYPKQHQRQHQQRDGTRMSSSDTIEAAVLFQDANGNDVEDVSTLVITCRPCCDGFYRHRRWNYYYSR
jgi:hypothetical protein